MDETCRQPRLEISKYEEICQFLPLDQPLDFSDSNLVVSTIFPTIFLAISPNSYQAHYPRSRPLRLSPSLNNSSPPDFSDSAW
ncbi:hypothetical protein PGTUg99_028494 [Puccinia graminis f. sp. tritici]|uniref:Uncharacterized protein n=1 Tax=Puccinia graminis f. sp. tritici TaxID=56615 RepID=A0A5B0QRU2_PUCGR|nr:hypothetical protein PGTUg99_028494 [Puccinia graminis f. sp. tritici]